VPEEPRQRHANPAKNYFEKLARLGGKLIATLVGHRYK
jgi:hypothetical protein